MKYCTAVLIAFCLFTKLSAQEQLGLRLETYAGVSSLSINPTGNLHNPLKWDINLAGGGFFFENNYASLRETSLSRLLRHRSDAEFLAAGDVEGPVSENTFIVDFFNDGAKRFVSANGFVAGPSVALRIGGNHSVGIFTNLRSAAGSFNIPNAFSYYKYDARPFHEMFEVPKLRGALLNWSEIGLNYALKIPTTNGSVNLGINLKYLQGYEAGYLESRTNYQHTKLPGNAVEIGLPDSRYGFAAKDFSSPFAGRNGRGLGADLGFTWVADEWDEGYRLKLGASLLDIGRIKFSKNAEAHLFQLDTSITLRMDDYEQYGLPDGLPALVHAFSENNLGDANASLVAHEFRMALPAALSLQADYCLSEKLYLNALFTQRLPTISEGPRRGNLLAVTPRVQHRWYSVSMPVSVYNWSRFHIGLAARLGWLVIGSDDVAGIFSNENYTGADFYFAIKLNPFDLGGNGGGRLGGQRHFGDRRKVKCYHF
jgi:hypothetical protein